MPRPRSLRCLRSVGPASASESGPEQASAWESGPEQESGPGWGRRVRRRSRSTVEHDVVAGAAVEDVLSATADQDVVAVAAVQFVVAGAADQHVVAVAAIGDERDPAAKPGGLDDIVAAETVDDELVAGAGIGDVHRFRQAGDRDHAVILGHKDDVVAGGPVDGHRIRGAVIGAEVEIDLLGAGPGQIADRDVVGAAEGIEVDVLDAADDPS